MSAEASTVDVITDLTDCHAGEVGHVVTIGTYDGVHLGHRAVIEATRRLARERGLASAVVTFDPHPAMVVRPESAPRLLVDLPQKLDLLAECGVDTVVVVPFDEVRSSETPEEFVASVLVDCLGTKAIIVGEDFHFGKNRAGDVALLGRLGRELGFEVRGLELVDQPSENRGSAAGEDASSATGPVSSAISSTAIRAHLAAGRVESAADLLGRFHEIRGPVVAGDQRGRTIGFPTANVAVPRDRAIPADGVYAAWYERPDGSQHQAAVNVGKRPTFYQDAEHSLIEAHLLDFDGDLYGEEARVRFVARLRPERRFDGIEELKAQLATDIEAARSALEAT